MKSKDDGQFGRLTIREEHEVVTTKRQKGCFLKYTTAIILAIVILALMVLVGVIVYFAKPTKSCGAGRSFWSLSAQERRTTCRHVINEMKEEICAGMIGPSSNTTGVPTVDTPVRFVSPRLNRIVVPTSYNIEVQPRLDPRSDFGFNGSVAILIKARKMTDQIVLNIEKLDIHKGSVILREDNRKGRRVAISKWHHDETRQSLNIMLSRPLLEGGMYYLAMTYNGTLLHKDQMGFYLSQYKDGNQTRYVASTQFEIPGARRAFPCFDETYFKATFNVTIVRQAAYTSLSNMPRRRSDARGNGWVADVYEQTVVMQTYLVALAVTQFTYREQLSSRGHRIRAWTRPPYIDSADYALGITGTILQTLEDWTDVSHKVPKVDMVAVPTFPYFAIENWGLIIYTEEDFLFSPTYSNIKDKLNIAQYIAHEISHQWFGNLVTTDWWDDIFLNEAVATYISYTYGVPGVEPSWNMEEYFATELETIMHRDMRAQSQPVFIFDIGVPKNWIRAFDPITYFKGGSILRMAEDFLGRRTFQEGVRKYLKRHAFKTVVHMDLFTALQEQAEADSRVTWDSSRTNVSDILDTWIKQIHYPLVTVTDLGNGRIRLSQSHFRYDHDEPLPYQSPFGKFIWDIPLTIADKDDVTNRRTVRKWMHKDKTVEVDGLDDDQWKLVNLYRRGYYRVLYDQDNYNKLLDQLLTDHQVIPVENRGALIDDSFSLARAGVMSDLNALKATQYMRREESYIPWRPALHTRTAFYDDMFQGRASHPHFETYMADLVIPMYNRSGWDVPANDGMDRRFTRQYVLLEACKRRYRPCVDRAQQEFYRFMDNPDNNRIHPDLHEVVYCTGVAHGGVREWEFLRDLLIQERSIYTARENVVITRALSCARLPSVIRTHLQYAVRKKKDSLMVDIANQPEAKDTAWSMVKENWDNLPDGDAKQTLLQTMAGKMTTQSQLKELRDFLSSRGHGADSAIYKTATRKVMANMDWLAANEGPITDWLKKVNNARNP